MAVRLIVRDSPRQSSAFYPSRSTCVVSARSNWRVNDQASPAAAALGNRQVQRLVRDLTAQKLSLRT